MKLVAERTVAHKVWQLLPVAQARRGQRSLQQIGGGRKKKWQTRGGDEAVCKMCRAVPAATYDSAPVVWNAVVGYCGHRTRGPVAGGQR